MPVSAAFRHRRNIQDEDIDTSEIAELDEHFFTDAILARPGENLIEKISSVRRKVPAVSVLEKNEMNKDNAHSAPETLARLQHHVESLIRAELYIGPALEWVAERLNEGDARFSNADLHGQECFEQLVEFRSRLETQLAQWRKQE